MKDIDEKLKDDIWKVVESWVVIPSHEMINDIFDLFKKHLKTAQNIEGEQ